MDTTDTLYTKRLVRLQSQGFKKNLWFLNPYLWHIRRIIDGKTLEVGCGIGRVLNFAPDKIVGVDHNQASIDMCKARGFEAYTTEDFLKAYKGKRVFSTLLLSHLLEHMTKKQACDLLMTYKDYLQDNAKIIAITPQEKGYQSDSTHVEMMDFSKLREIYTSCGIKSLKHYSFPFPRFMGTKFIYNEFVMIGRVAK